MARNAIVCKRYENCPLAVLFHYTPIGQALRVKSHSSWVASAKSYGSGHLDLECGASQTKFMSHIYIKLDFGTDEEKAQQARHKLDGWKQAFRLDKRLLYKLDRPENVAAAEKPAPAVESKGKSKDKSGERSADKPGAAANGKVSLLVRLYFSSHEKLSEQRWVDRIPSEEPFKSASPKVILQTDPEFEKADQQFEALD